MKSTTNPVEVKRFAGVFLVLCFIFPFAGSYCWMRYKKHLIKKEIKWKIIAGLDLHDLVQIKVTGKEAGLLRWKHAGEFEFKGEMYDIVSKEIHGDTVLYRCWWDHEETMLNKQLQKLVLIALGQDQHNKKQQTELNNFLKHLFQSNFADWKISLRTSVFYGYSHDFWFHQSPHFIPGTPPPELI